MLSELSATPAVPSYDPSDSFGISSEKLWASFMYVLFGLQEVMNKLIITEKANAARRISTILSDGKSQSLSLIHI